MAARKKTSARRAAKTPPKKKKTAARARKTAKPKRPTRRKPETLRLRVVTPSFTVNDIHRSLAWYQNVLGFVVEERWEQDGVLGGASLRAGNATLYLGQDDWKKGRDRKKGEGVRLFCSTAQDLDMLADGIKTRGGILDHDPMDQPWGTRDFGLTDPDGYRITIASV